MITRDKVKKFRIDFDEAVQKLAKDYDVEISLGTITLSNTEFHGRMTVKVNSVGGVETDKYHFDKECHFIGLKPEDYGKSFVANGKHLTVKGIDLHARKNTVILEGSDGKTYKSTPSLIRLYIKPEDKMDTSSDVDVRKQLELEYGQVWDTDELQQDFRVQGFAYGIVVVVRHSDNVRGSMSFTHMPRFYYNFVANP